jgi:N-acyl-L-homoserine lactone synthetase
MIIVIDGLNEHRFQDVLEDMYRLRARVFEGRLGWDVEVKDGMEVDQFDHCHPAHVVSLDGDGRVVGCMRLLQTTGPHMLADVFNSILDGEPPLRSAQVWEATRFCVDTQRLNRGRDRNSISYVTSEVMLGAFEYARKSGVLDAVAVIDPVMNRVLKRSGNGPIDYLGTAKPMGKVVAMAALMDCSDERIASIRDYAGISADVFLTEDEALSRFTPHEPTSALVEYFKDQLLAVKTQDDLEATRRLVDRLSDQLTTTQRTRLMRIEPASLSTQ